MDQVNLCEHKKTRELKVGQPISGDTCDYPPVTDLPVGLRDVLVPTLKMSK